MKVDEQVPADPGNGLFVVFEGVDGSGKSTLAKAWIEHITRLGVRAPLYMPFPTHDGPVGKLIREGFAGTHQLTEATYGYLMMADCMESQARIYHNVREGRVVVADRYAPVSGFAYQQEVWSMQELLNIQNKKRILEPSVTFIVNVDAETAITRMAERGAPRNKIFEKDSGEYITRLISRYLAYAFLHPRVIILDGTKSTGELIGDVQQALQTAFKIADQPEPVVS